MELLNIWLDKICQNIRVTEKGCWETPFCRYWNGYSIITVNKKRLRLHRIAYELFIGTIPKGMCVCHKCDNPPCCNPSHLFLGTHQDNMNDRKRKGRNGSCKGSANHLAKLKEADVICIRRSNESTQMLAKRFGVSVSTIGAVKRFQNWKWLNG